MLQGELPVRINNSFRLPILGLQSGDILEDRVQYGRLPYSLSCPNSNEPIVCNIFSNMTYIRFAMMSPLRIVEFHGNFKNIFNP